MPSGLNGLECLLDFSRCTRVFSWNPHLSTKAAFFKIMFHWFFIMFIVFSLFSRCFSLFFIDLSLFWRWCSLCSFVFHYLTMFVIIFHWFFNVWKMCFIFFICWVDLLQFTCIFCKVAVHGRHRTVENSKFSSFRGFRTK